MTFDSFAVWAIALVACGVEVRCLHAIIPDRVEVVEEFREFATLKSKVVASAPFKEQRCAVEGN